MADVLSEILASGSDLETALSNVGNSLSSSSDTTTSDGTTPGAGLFASVGSAFTSLVSSVQGIASSGVVGEITSIVNQGSASTTPTAAQTTTQKIVAAASSPTLWIVVVGALAVFLIARK